MSLINYPPPSFVRLHHSCPSTNDRPRIPFPTLDIRWCRSDLQVRSYQGGSQLWRAARCEQERWYKKRGTGWYGVGVFVITYLVRNVYIFFMEFLVCVSLYHI